MKRTILFAAIAALFIAGCSKGSGTSVTPSTTCVCTFRKNPMKDTTIRYGVSADSAKASCDYKQKVLASQYSNTACHLE